VCLASSICGSASELIGSRLRYVKMWCGRTGRGIHTTAMAQPPVPWRRVLLLIGGTALIDQPDRTRTRRCTTGLVSWILIGSDMKLSGEERLFFFPKISVGTSHAISVSDHVCVSCAFPVFPFLLMSRSVWEFPKPLVQINWCTYFLRETAREKNGRKYNEGGGTN
jgi:hypothetical protein